MDILVKVIALLAKRKRLAVATHNLTYKRC
jgi:hypothetical protein